MKIKEFSYFLIGILFISGINNLFSMDPAVQLFMGIKTNSLEDVEKAIIAGADLNSKDVLSGKTALYEAIKNFYDQSNKPFNLKLRGTLAGLAGVFSGSYVSYILGKDIKDYFHEYRYWSSNYKEKSNALNQGKTRFEGWLLNQDSVDESKRHATGAKEGLIRTVGAEVGTFLAAIGSAFAVWSLGKASWRLRNKISTSWSIVSRIYFEMNKKGIIADEESVKFMEKLVPQLDAASKKLERKIKQ